MLHAVHFWRKMIHHQNMAGKQECAQQYHRIATAQGELADHAQKVQSNYAQYDAQPDLFIYFAAHKKCQNGNDQYIHRGDETGFCRSGSAHTDLLCGGSQKQEKTAADAAQQQPLFIAGAFGQQRNAGTAFAAGIHRGDDRQQHNTAQITAAGQKRKRTDMLGADALGDECRTPNQCRQGQKKCVSDLFGIHE